MSTKANFELSAAYNHRINDGIYAAASHLNCRELAKDRGAFFGSILGTLNHIIVADIIWLKRFAEHEQQFSSLAYAQQLAVPATLDAILYSEFDTLIQARKEKDDVILAFTNELTEDVISKPLAYVDSKDRPYIKNFDFLLQHHLRVFYRGWIRPG